MTQDSGHRVWRVLGIAVLAIATLGFGAMSLCGAAFTLMSLPDMFSNHHENYAAAALIFSVPSLLIGGAVAWWCVRLLRRLLRGDPQR